IFKTLSHALKAAGATWKDVVKINGYMVNLNPADVNVYREVRSRYFEHEHMPASTLVGIERLVHEDLMLEVELIAAVGASAKAASAKVAPAKKAKPKKKR